MFIFPIAAFFILVLIFSRWTAAGLRTSFCYAAMAWGLLVVGLTEGLSHGRLLTFPYLSLSWICIILLLLISGPFFRSATLPSFPKIPKFERYDRVLLAAIVLVLILVGVTAGMAAPNTWDSLTYHMARVSHWMQNGTVAHFPTNIVRQNFYQPFAEYAVLQFQVLSGTDRLANFVQWFAMFGSLITVSLITRYFGGGLREQIFSAFFCATIPMGIVQGSSTQNDYVAAFLISNFVYFGLVWKKEGTWFSLIAMAAALALGFLTKGMMGIFAMPFLVWFLAVRLKKDKAKIALFLLVIGLICLAVNAGHYQRNLATSGRLFGDPSESRSLCNDRMNAQYLLSNILRNMGLHAATSLKPLNRGVENGMESIHKILGVSSTDQATTYGADPLHVEVSTHEDAAGNFLQLALFLFSAGIFFTCRERDPEIFKYLFAVTAAFLLFNILAKWSPSASRYHLPFFVLFSPFVAILLTDAFKKRQIVLYLICLFLFTTACPYLFRNSTRKLYSSKKTVFTTPRLDQYFANWGEWEAPYQQAVETIAKENCRQVGLRSGGNTWEYPFWVLFRKYHTGLRIEHVDVPALNPADYPLGTFSPCAIIEVGRSDPGGKQLTVNGKVFYKEWEQSPVGVYVAR